MALLSLLRNLRNQNKMKKLRYLVNTNHAYVLLRQTFSSTCTNQRNGISEPQKLQLKHEIENYINNHKYTMIAATADVCKQKFQEHVIRNNLGEPFTSRSSIWQFPWKRTEKDKPFIYENSENIFARGYDALEDYLHGEKVDHQACAAFTALERFYNNKELHERNLAQLNSTNQLTKTETASLLTSHLLSQLLYNPTNHIIDASLYGDPPYDFSTPLQYGYTNFGSTRLFYGSSDITLFPTTMDMCFDSHTDAAVFHVGEPEERPEANRLHPQWNTDDDDYDDEEEICDENNGENFNDADINLVCKQAISLSMWKHKQRILAYSGNQDYSSSIVPICAINKHKYMVVLYNAQHDYLLKMQKKDFLKNFNKDKLEFSTIINLWMLIHHNLFCTEQSDDAIQILKGTGGLIKFLGEDAFKEVVRTSKFDYDIDPSGNEFEVDVEYDSIPASGAGRSRKYQKINREQ